MPRTCVATVSRRLPQMTQSTVELAFDFARFASAVAGWITVLHPERNTGTCSDLGAQVRFHSRSASVSQRGSVR